MGLFSTLFGSPAKSKSKTFVDPTQQPYLENLYGAGQSAYNQAAAAGPYQGPTYAQLTPEQLGVVSQGLNYSSGLGALAPGAVIENSTANLQAGASFGDNAQSIVNGSTGLIEQALAAANSPEADALVEAASRDTVRNLTENQLPALERAAVGTGNRDSSRTGAMAAVLERGADDRIADISSQTRQRLVNDRFSQGLAQYNTALAANSQVGQAGQNAVGAFGTALGLQAGNQSLGFDAADRLQLNNQGILDEATGQYDRNRLDGLQLAGAYRDVLGAPTILSEGTQTGGSSGIFGKVLGGLTSLKGLGGIAGIGSMFSDRRLKDNLEHTGQSVGGHNVYRWDWNEAAREVGAHEQLAWGVIAQEVQLTNPDAVSEENGYLKVDYSKL